MKKKLIIAASVILIVGLTVGLTIYGMMPVKDQTYHVTLKELRKKVKDDYFIPNSFPFDGEVDCEYNYDKGLFAPKNFTIHKKVSFFLITIKGHEKKLEIANQLLVPEDRTVVEYRGVSIVYYYSPDGNSIYMHVGSIQKDIGLAFGETWESEAAKAEVRNDLKMLIDQVIDYIESVPQ